MAEIGDSGGKSQPQPKTKPIKKEVKSSYSVNDIIEACVPRYYKVDMSISEGSDNSVHIICGNPHSTHSLNDWQTDYLGS